MNKLLAHVIILCACMLLIVKSSIAQSSKSSSKLSPNLTMRLSVPVYSSYFKSNNGNNQDAHFVWLPINFHAETSLSKRVSFGAVVNFIPQRFTFSKTVGGGVYNYEQKSQLQNFLLKFNVKILRTDSDRHSLALGFGAGIGMRQRKLTLLNPQAPYTPITNKQTLPNFELSCRYDYCFNKSIGTFLELGLMQSPVRVGLLYKLDFTR